MEQQPITGKGFSGTGGQGWKESYKIFSRIAMVCIWIVKGEFPESSAKTRGSTKVLHDQRSFLICLHTAYVRFDVHSSQFKHAYKSLS